jgi:hypothetical protein
MPQKKERNHTYSLFEKTNLLRSFADSKDFELIITDLNGKVMMKTTSSTVNISSFASGTYLYQLKSGNRVGSGKLIKK